jgi:two-component system, NtrC family, sensor kinase
MPAAPLLFAISHGHGGASVVAGAHAFARALGNRLGDPIKNHVSQTYDDLLADLLTNRVHVAWLPPLLHARASAEGAVIAAVLERQHARTYRSAILVRADSPLTLAAIKGVRAAWTDPKSAAGHIFPRLHLKAAGVDLEQAFASERFAGSYTAACGAVADGQADLCGCFVTEAAAASKDAAMAEVKTAFAAAPWRLKILAITESIPADAVVLARAVDPAQGSRITTALLSLHLQADGRDALFKLMNAQRLVAPDVTFTNAVARLRRDLGLP